MKILALDISSKAAGFAFDRPGRGPAFGVIRPPATLPPEGRIDVIVDGIADLVRESAPDIAVIEWSGGKQHGKIARKMSGLSVLGASQGAARQKLRDLGIRVEAVREARWTGSRPKAERAADIRLVYPAYARWADEFGRDGGLDVADALGILEWYRGKEAERRILEGSSR